MIRKLLSLLFLGTVALSSYGTHNLAGEITYKHLSGLTYEFTFTIYADANSPAIARREIEVNWGDQTKLDSINLTSQVEITTAPFAVLKRVWRTTHTFPGPAFTYRISVEDPNRNANVINMDNSINVPFTMQTELTIPVFTGDENNSVQLRNDPIDRACAGVRFIYNPGAFDPDGTDSLSYSIAPSRGGRDAVAPNYVFPQASDSLTIDPLNGDLIWDTPVQSGIYNIAILIKEYRRGFFVGSVLRDIQITVEGNCNNTAPAIFSDNLVCVVAGSTLTTLISTTDSDTQDRVTLTASGELFETPINSRTNFNIQSPGNPVNTSFTWNTICEDVRLRNYSLNLRVEDNASVRGSVNLVNFKSVDIKVISPGPKNASAQASGKSIALTWDNLDCPNASGYYVYRRKDSSGFVPANCVTGVPDGILYDRIYETTDVNQTSFIDDNNGEGLIPGQKYCYLITKYYPDDAESYVSNEVCSEIEKIIPVMTNVSIISTDEISGELFLGWSPPDTFDRQAFPAPYRYLIHEIENNTITIIDSTNSIDDTLYNFSSTNTENSSRRFKVDLISLGNGRLFVGSSSVASSIYLITVPSDEKVELSWNDQTPWNNLKFDIFRRRQGETQFDSIGTATSTTFTDFNVENGINYCYYIRSTGEYNLNSVAHPILNLSQEACSTPIDNVPPCSPSFTLKSDCDEGFMELKWNDLRSNCAPDLASYRVYFAENTTSEKTLLFQTTNLDDTSYIAPPDSVGGCFIVVAVDSTGNESISTDLQCAPYCPIYELPNVFTPNGDGFNDLFVPIKPYKYVDSIHIQIFNRWGEVVFTTDDIDINWTGEHQNIRITKANEILNSSNQNVSSAIYFFVCEVFELSLEPTKPRIIEGTITALDSKIIQERQ